MIRYHWLQDGLLFAMRYEFMEAGDKLPRHSHAPAEAHNVIVLKGSIAFEISGARLIFRAGEVVKFDNALEHEITALENETLTQHYFLNGMPREYAALPDSCHRGTIA